MARVFAAVAVAQASGRQRALEKIAVLGAAGVHRGVGMGLLIIAAAGRDLEVVTDRFVDAATCAP
ncbi:hypothetical protein [Nocardia aurantiaca]|uniref:Uncharacterized protein n=1 Tax=Nocardia aurantiaca TaxID=2675850 RepID=A0A6I3L5A7_9NOCA|nr:hypothetical protein [Nocardia aurantiaca]MTE16160.1 hypothetical protein [Nocardia aurantiaca]